MSSVGESSSFYDTHDHSTCMHTILGRVEGGRRGGGGGGAILAASFCQPGLIFSLRPRQVILKTKLHLQNEVLW